MVYFFVVYMSLVIGGLMVLMSWGWGFFYFLMIVYGFCFFGLFFLVNLFYEWLGSWSLMINKGMLSFMFSVVMWWFLLCVSNMVVFFIINLLGEIGLLNSIVGWFKMLMVLLVFIFFFSVVYFCIFIFFVNMVSLIWGIIFFFCFKLGVFNFKFINFKKSIYSDFDLNLVF